MSLPLSETDRWKAWDTFLEATHETGFMQSSWWAEFRAKAGFEYFGLTLQDISVFKRKFGGTELNLVPTLDYDYDSAAYRQYVAKECDSDSETAN